MEPAVEDRRTAQRHCEPEAHGILLARVRPGHAAWIVDVSSVGALVETRRRLLPGTSIELSVQTADRQASLRGRVVRCSVVRVQATTIWYRGAVDFDRPVSWLNREPATRLAGVHGTAVARLGNRVPGFPTPAPGEQPLPATATDFIVIGTA